MSGISGGHPRELTPAQDKFFGQQLKRIKAEEKSQERRRTNETARHPITGTHRPRPRAAREDDDA